MGICQYRLYNISSYSIFYVEINRKLIYDQSKIMTSYIRNLSRRRNVYFSHMFTNKNYLHIIPQLFYANTHVEQHFIIGHVLKGIHWYCRYNAHFYIKCHTYSWVIKNLDVKAVIYVMQSSAR